MLILLFLVIESLNQPSIFFLLSLSMRYKLTQVSFQSLILASIFKVLRMFLTVQQFLLSLVNSVLILQINNLTLNFLREIFFLLYALDYLYHLLSHIEFGLTNLAYLTSLLYSIFIWFREGKFFIDAVLAPLLCAKFADILPNFRIQDITAAEARMINDWDQFHLLFLL